MHKPTLPRALSSTPQVCPAALPASSAAAAQAHAPPMQISTSKTPLHLPPLTEVTTQLVTLPASSASSPCVETVCIQNQRITSATPVLVPAIS